MTQRGKTKCWHWQEESQGNPAKEKINEGQGFYRHEEGH